MTRQTEPKNQSPWTFGIRRLFLPCLVLCSLILAAGVWADEPKTYEELVTAIEKSASEVKSLSSDFEMTMNMMGMEMAMKGTLIALGESMTMEITMDMMGQEMEMKTIMGADKIQWTEMNMMGQLQVMKMDMSKMMEMSSGLTGLPNPMASGSGPFGFGQDPREMLESYALAFDLVVKGTDTIDGTKVYLVEGTMKKDLDKALDPTGAMNQMGISMDKAIFAIGAEDGLPRKMEIFGADGKPFMTMVMKNVQLNIDVDEDRFRYTPPDGVAVMDMTALLEQNMAAASSNETDEFEGNFKIGDLAPDFEVGEISGKTVSLSDYQGKVVLVDFWATWCGPCIQELPNVIAAYEKYHPKGFEIVGVSLDESKKDLKKFLKAHPKMTWVQNFDGKGWENAVGKIYGVQSIPYTLLLDRTGKIVNKDLRGDALGAAVGQLLAAAAE